MTSQTLIIIIKKLLKLQISTKLFLISYPFNKKRIFQNYTEKLYSIKLTMFTVEKDTCEN